MLNPDSKLVYDALRSLVGDDDVYKIIEADEVLEKLPADKQFTKVQLSAIVRDLKDREYIGVKYFTPDEYCLLTYKRFDDATAQPVVVAPSKPATKKEKAERVPYAAQAEQPEKQAKPVKKGTVFFMAFLGALLGSAVVAAIAIVIARFVL